MPHILAELNRIQEKCYNRHEFLQATNILAMICMKKRKKGGLRNFDRNFYILELQDKNFQLVAHSSYLVEVVLVF